jgi:hypothetical protein
MAQSRTTRLGGLQVVQAVTITATAGGVEMPVLILFLAKFALCASLLFPALLFDLILGVFLFGIICASISGRIVATIWPPEKD